MRRIRKVIEILRTLDPLCQFITRPEQELRNNMKYAPGLMSAVRSERTLLRDSTIDDELFRTYGVSRPVQGKGANQVTHLENQPDEQVNL
jgi:hypothetical protein